MPLINRRALLISRNVLDKTMWDWVMYYLRVFVETTAINKVGDA